MADYIDRQAAIAALDKFAEECRGSAKAGVAFAMAAMAKSVILNLPSPWMDAKENPPKKDGSYFCYYKFPKLDGNGEYDFLGELFYFASYDRPRFEGAHDGLVSHWMPLPDEPNINDMKGE